MTSDLKTGNSQLATARRARRAARPYARLRLRPAVIAGIDALVARFPDAAGMTRSAWLRLALGRALRDDCSAHGNSDDALQAAGTDNLKSEICNLQSGPTVCITFDDPDGRLAELTALGIKPAAVIEAALARAEAAAPAPPPLELEDHAYVLDDSVLG